MDAGLCLIPRNWLVLASLETLEAPDRYLIPCLANIVVDGLDSVEELVGQPTLVVLGQGECLLKKFLGRIGHEMIVNREVMERQPGETKHTPCPSQRPLGCGAATAPTSLADSPRVRRHVAPLDAGIPRIPASEVLAPIRGSVALVDALQNDRNRHAADGRAR